MIVVICCVLSITFQWVFVLILHNKLLSYSLSLDLQWLFFVCDWPIGVSKKDHTLGKIQSFAVALCKHMDHYTYILYIFLYKCQILYIIQRFYIKNMLHT